LYFQNKEVVTCITSGQDITTHGNDPCIVFYFRDENILLAKLGSKLHAFHHLVEGDSVEIQRGFPRNIQ